MKLFRYVVLAERVRGFDDLKTAREFACKNFPAVICERSPGPEGNPQLVEIERHDFLYDADRKEWRVMLA